MISRSKHAMLGVVLSVLFAGPLTVQAAPSGSSQSSSAYSAEDLYYDYEVWRFDYALSEWYLWDTFDTYEEAEYYAFKVSIHGLFPVKIERVRALPAYRSIR